MISIIIPSVRPHELAECLDSIAASKDVDYEVILITDFAVNDEFMEGIAKWQIIVEKERRGNIAAIAEGYEAARGEYIFTLSDEARIYPDTLFQLQEFCISCNNNILCSPRHIPDFPFYYYGKYFAPFPFCHRSLVDRIGGVFLDTAYKSFYADPDLSMRAHEAHIPVLHCREAMILHPNNMHDPAHKHNVSAYVKADRELFRKKWDHLGEFVDP